MYVPCIQILIPLPPPLPTTAPSSTTSVHSGSSMHSSRRSQRKFSLATDDIKVCVYNGTGVYPSVSLYLFIHLSNPVVSSRPHGKAASHPLPPAGEQQQEGEHGAPSVGPSPASPSFPHLTPWPYRSAAEFGGHEAATEGGRSRKEVLMFLRSGNNLWVYTIVVTETLCSWDLAMVYGCLVITATFPSLVPPWSPLLTVADHVM